MRTLGPDDVFDIDASGLPVAFDIVWCKYPYRQHGNEPGPVARPCLVRQAFTRATLIKGHSHVIGYVDVVYGTKQIDKFLPPQGFHVYEDAEKRACGLTYDTAFDLRDHMLLPWSPVYFSSDKSRPVIGGHFTNDMQIRLKEQAAQLRK